MKFTVISILFVFATSVAPAFAAPVPYLEAVNLDDITERDDHDAFEDLSERNIHNLAKTAHAAVKWLGHSSNHAKINAKPLLLWSGHTTTPSGKKIQSGSLLKTFNHNDAHHTVPGLMKDHGHDTAGWKKKEWASVCGAACAAVRGTVRFMGGKTISSKSVWKTHELPALMKNHDVHTVEHHQIQDGGHVVQQPHIKGK